MNSLVLTLFWHYPGTPLVLLFWCTTPFLNCTIKYKNRNFLFRGIQKTKRGYSTLPLYSNFAYFSVKTFTITFFEDPVLVYSLDPPNVGSHNIPHLLRLFCIFSKDHFNYGTMHSHHWKRLSEQR